MLPEGLGGYGQIWAVNGHLRAFYFENGLGYGRHKKRGLYGVV